MILWTVQLSLTIRHFEMFKWLIMLKISWHCLNRVLMVCNYYSWYCVNANQLPTPTFYMHECQDSLIQCSTSRVCVSIQIPCIYLSLLWTTVTVQHTSAQSIITFSALILAGGGGVGEGVRFRLITERDRGLVLHVCSYHMIK